MTDKTRQIRICYIAGRERTYSRTAILLKGLERAGFHVTGIFPPDKRFRHYPGLIRRFVRQSRHSDLVVVGFYGQILMFIVRLLTRKPVLYDVYISTYDTMVYDRGKAGAGTLAAKLYWWADRITMLWADRILLETEDHIQDYGVKFKVPLNRFEHLFLAVDDDLIRPAGEMGKKDFFLVHFHGEYAPFHGVSTILKAAHILRDENVRFEIIGTGITYQDDRRLAAELSLGNVRFIDWVPYDALAESMGRADCCLGIFGDNPRTFRVLTNKVVETLAAARPLITVRNQPVQELVEDPVSALLVPPADPEALAEAILRLKSDSKLRTSIGEAGYRQFQNHCTLDVFSRRLKEIILNMAGA